MVDFRILGPVELRDGNRRIEGVTGRQLEVFTYLLLNANRYVSIDRLSEAIWGGGVANDRVRVAVARLRKLLQPEPEMSGLLETLPAGYRLRVPDGCVDADRFKSRLKAAEELEAEDLDTARAALRTAGELWRGEPLGNFSGCRWAEPYVNELLDALERRFECDLRLGRHELVVSELERFTSHYPTRERLVEEHMLALYRCGRQTDALMAFQRAYRELSKAGIVPRRELTELQRRILEHSPQLELPDREPRRAAPTPVARAQDLIGREREVEALEAHLDAVRSGERRVLVVSGEPGIGKTSLVKHLRETVRDAHVLYGAAVDTLVGQGRAFPYQPFVEALRPCLADARARSGLKSELRELARIMPFPVGAEPPDPGGDPAFQEFCLFEAAVSVLEWATRERPTVLILDDFQSADAASRDLLLHLVHVGRPGKLFVVVVHRRDDALDQFVVDLHHEDAHVERLEVTGLRDDHAAELVQSRLPDADSATVNELVGATSGNPLFLRELTENWLARAPGEHILPLEEFEPPRSVIHLVKQRLARFDDETLAALRAAAVAGRDFDLVTVAHCIERPLIDVRDALDAPRETGLITTTSVPDRFSFSHGLVRAALYRSLKPSRRARLHLRAGEALETAPECHPGELAHHYWHALDIGGTERALEHLTEAARVSDIARAYKDAALYCERAVTVIDRLNARGSQQHGELLVVHGHVLEYRGDSKDAREAFCRAADIAREHSNPRLLAQAALGWGRVPSRADAGEAALLDAVTTALDCIDHGEIMLRSRLMGRRAVELATPAGWTEEADALSKEAVRLAKLAGDDGVLSAALGSRHWALAGPKWLDKRCALSKRSLEIAHRAQDQDRILSARQWRIFDLFELGEFPGLLEQLDAYERLARVLGHPSECAFARVMRVPVRLLIGDVESAPALIDEASEMLKGAGDPDAARVHALQSFALHKLTGDLDAAVEAAHACPKSQDGKPKLIAGALQAWALAAAGRTDKARSAAPDVAAVPEDREWLATMTALAHYAAAVPDLAAARAVRSALDRYEDRIASLEAIVAFGPVAKPLARLAEMLEDGDAARLRAIAHRHDAALHDALERASQPVGGNEAGERTVPAGAGAADRG